MDRGQLTMPFSEANIYPRLSLCRNRGSVMFSFSLSARFVNNGGHTTRTSQRPPPAYSLLCSYG